MTSGTFKELRLEELASGINPGISSGFGTSVLEAAAICFVDQGHSTGVLLQIEGDFKDKFEVHLPNIQDKWYRTWNDLEATTEHGAYGVAFLIILNLTNYTIIERSRKGTGFDFWLGEKDNADDWTQELPFQNKARLEVSGIRKGNDAAIKSRTSKKKIQIDSSNRCIPGFVIIVEFGNPISHVIKK